LEKRDKIKVLYIDDEVNNLQSFKATFRYDYQVLLASSAQEALDVMASESDICVVLSDQRMPSKTGIQFFEEMRHLYPLPVRILITAYTDIETVIDGINRGHIFRYIKKPWVASDIQMAIEEAYKFYVSTHLLERRNAELLVAYEELGKFAYSVTHDIKGPLLSALGAIDVASSIDDIFEMRAILEMMDTSLKKLDIYIKSIHNYYSLKRGQLTFEAIQFDKIINDMVDLFRLAGVTEQVRFEVDIEQIGSFYSDAVTISVVINNLISNAVKYQKISNIDKYVGIAIRANEQQAQIVVKDNGIGIDAKYIGQIYNMFYRATDQDSGAGFGLYNVKEAIHKLNGSIEVLSELNEGTTFIVKLPSKANGGE